MQTCCWNNVVQIPYVWFLLTHTSWYSLHCVLCNICTNMYIPVHRNHELWPIPDLLTGNSIQSCVVTKIMIFTTLRLILVFLYLIESDRTIKFSKTLNSWSPYWRPYYSLCVSGIDITEPTFPIVFTSSSIHTHLLKKDLVFHSKTTQHKNVSSDILRWYCCSVTVSTEQSSSYLTITSTLLVPKDFF